MYISKEKFHQIKARYSTLIILDDDAAEALNFVHDLMEAESDALEEKEPYAIVSMMKLDDAAYQALALAQEVREMEA